MESPPSSKLKKRIITWTSIFVVLVITFFGIMKLGIHYSSDILFQLVKNETNGFYQLSFEEIKIDYWNKAIKLKKVVLKPDSSKDFSAKGFINLYDLELGGLNIDLKSISSIYLDQQLVIENVRIIDPQVHVIRESQAPKESFSLQTGNFYKEISDYLKVLQIDFFSIQNAEFEHSPSELGLGNIDFFVSNLLIDSESRTDQSFYSENIELEIRNQSFKLNDSIHQLSFDRLLLSTADSVLIFENLILKPLTNLHGTFEKHDDKIVYDITIPNLKLKGVDYFSAYQNNQLIIDELSLTDSHIFLKEQTHHVKKDQSTSKENSLIKQLIKIFDEVKIGKMSFVNSNLDLTTNDDKNHNYQHIQSERADIILYNIILDSTNYNFDHREKYFDDVDITIKDYSSYLPDSIHTINFDLLHLSSFDSSLVFKNFKINDNGKENTSDMFLSVDLPLISLRGMDFLDILVRKKLLITEMQLQNPNIIFEKRKRKGKVQKSHFSPRKAFSLISDQFNIVKIKKLKLEKGMFSINKQLNFNQTDLLVSNFNIHSKSKSWYDVLAGVDLNLENMVLNDDKIQLEADHIILDHEASHLILNDLNLNYLDQYNSISGDLSKLTISGINLDSISMGNLLAFDSIKLNKPEIKFELLKPNKESIKNPLRGNKVVEIVKGRINGKIYDTTAFSLKNVNTKLSIGAINNVHYAQAEEIKLTLPKAAHQLTISELSFSESQDLLLKNIQFESLESTLLSKAELNGSIPTLSLHGLDQDLFWQQNKLAGDSLIIESPGLNLNLNDLKTALVQKDTFEVQFQKIKLNKADLTFSNKRQTAFEMIKTPELSITLEAFHFPQKSLLNADHLIFADNVILSVRDFQPIMTNGDSVIIGNLDFNKKEALIIIDSSSFNQANSVTSALLPRLKLIGLDLHAYLNEKQLKLDSIYLTAPQIYIDQNIPKAQEQDTTKDILELIDIKYFSTIETEIKLIDSLSPTNYAFHKGKFEVHEFFVDGEIIWNQFFNYAQLASLSGENLIIPMDDGYELSIDKYSLKHPNNTLALDNINLTSEFTATEYSYNLTAQNDWFDVSVDSITFSGLDFERSMSLGEYYSQKIILDGLNALVYRDKSVPFHRSTVKELPQSVLRNLDTWLHIDTVQVKGDLIYQEKPANQETVAEISFNNLDAYLLNISSVDSLNYLPMSLISTGKLAASANFEINVVFDLRDSKDKFSLVGQVDQMQLGALNKMLKPVANINIKDGYAEQIRFDLIADNEIARGEMAFRYHNLKVQILNKETHDLKGLGQGIMTFFANTFVVKHKNPNFIFLRKGKIFQQRDSTRAIFNYWGKALLSGAVSSVGIHKSKKAEKKYKREVKENKK